MEIPLGGDGWTAPRSLYAVEVSLTHDASGGNAQIDVFTDPRYTSLVSYMCMTQTSVAADTTPCQYAVVQNGDDLWINVVSGLKVGATTISTASPPGMLLISNPQQTPFVQCILDNIDTEVSKLNMRIYNFEREMIRQVPISLAMLTLPR